MGGTSGGDTVMTIRHPDYAEVHHSGFLTEFTVQLASALAVNPHTDYVYRNIDADFFGVGYLFSSYVTLHDMFGKFMAGLDLEELWRSSISDVLTQEEMYTHIAEKKQKLDDEIDTQILPTFKRGMRDINAVASSSFIIGCAKIESKRVKDYAAISLEVTANLIPTIFVKFTTELAWCKNIVADYAKIMKAYFSYRIDTDISGYTLRAEDVLWPFTVLDFDRRALNALGPQHLENMTTLDPTWLEKNKLVIGGVSIIAWTAQGAYIGSSYPPYGTIIGAVIGFVVGVALYFMQ
uniref:Uncharacterized protein n=1 Tax=viral metagenome TaxID=1070528 RepID=A0A6M3KDX2_9ZZZZ